MRIGREYPDEDAIMEEQKRTGIPVQEFTFGMVHATVWANRAQSGGLVLKISLRRLETSRDGVTVYRSAFYPEDLEDIDVDVVARCVHAAFRSPDRSYPSSRTGPSRSYPILASRTRQKKNRLLLVCRVDFSAASAHWSVFTELTADGVKAVR